MSFLKSNRQMSCWANNVRTGKRYSFSRQKKYRKFTKRQECIPVGCVPPACCPYLPACTVPGGCTWSWAAYLVPGGCTCLGGVPGPGGVYLRGGIPGHGGCTWSGLGVYLPEEYLPRYSPPVNRMTNRCKNITLPQTCLRAVTTKQLICLPIQWTICGFKSRENLLAFVASFNLISPGIGMSRLHYIWDYYSHLINEIILQQSEFNLIISTDWCWLENVIFTAR